MTNRAIRTLILVGIAFFTAACFRETGSEILPVNATKVSEDNAEELGYGIEAGGRIGDYLLQSNHLQMVLNGRLSSNHRDYYLARSGGAVLDISTRFEGTNREFFSRNDDGLNLLTQCVNMNRNLPVSYERVLVDQDNQDEAALTLVGVVYDFDGSLAAAGASVDSVSRRVQGVEVVTTYNLRNLETIPGQGGADDTDPDDDTRIVTFVTMETVIVNNTQQTLPIFTVGDVAVTAVGAANLWVPYPDWGFEKPADGSFAYPPFVQIQTTQSNIAQYAFLSRMEEVVMADYENGPNNEFQYLYVGKARRRDQSLASQEQLTYLRELSVLNLGDSRTSGVAPSTAYSQIQLLLSDQPSSQSMFNETGEFRISFQTSGAPSEKAMIEYVDQSVRYYNGTEYVTLEEGRTFPFLGEKANAPGYVVNLPTGRVRVFADALNLPPAYKTTKIIEIDNGEDEEPTQEEVPLDIVAGELCNAGALLLSDEDDPRDFHAGMTIGATNGEGRLLFTRMMFEQLSGSQNEPFSLSILPRPVQGNIVYRSVTTQTNLSLPKGSYEIVASRGPKHVANIIPVVVEEQVIEADDEDEEDQIIVAAEPGNLNIVLSPAFEFPGYFSADFGALSANDPKSLMSSNDLLRMAYAEDLDVVFFPDFQSQGRLLLEFQLLGGTFGAFDEQDTDDNVFSWFDEMQISRSTGMIALENGYNTAMGRWSVYNFPDEEVNEYLEIPQVENDPSTWYSRVRRQSPQVVIQCDRPRGRTGLSTGLFTTVARREGLSENTPIPGDAAAYQGGSATGAEGTLLDFDLLQVLAGNHYDEYLLVRQDWFNLLNAGIFKPATGGSLGEETLDLPIGAVRTWVSVTDTELRDNELVEFWDQVKAGHSFISNGPLIEADIAGNGPGQTTSVSGGTVTVNVKITAAPWIPVRQVRVVVDGVVQPVEIPLKRDGHVRFEGQIEVELPAGNNHWVVVEAGASLEEIAAGEGLVGTFGRIYPGHVPLAFTNPIFVNN